MASSHERAIGYIRHLEERAAKLEREGEEKSKQIEKFVKQLEERAALLEREGEEKSREIERLRALAKSQSESAAVVPMKMTENDEIDTKLTEVKSEAENKAEVQDTVYSSSSGTSVESPTVSNPLNLSVPSKASISSKLVDESTTQNSVSAAAKDEAIKDELRQRKRAEIEARVAKALKEREEMERLEFGHKTKEAIPVESAKTSIFKDVPGNESRFTNEKHNQVLAAPLVVGGGINGKNKEVDDGLKVAVEQSRNKKVEAKIQKTPEISRSIEHLESEQFPQVKNGNEIKVQGESKAVEKSAQHSKTNSRKKAESTKSSVNRQSVSDGPVMLADLEKEILTLSPPKSHSEPTLNGAKNHDNGLPKQLHFGEECKVADENAEEEKLREPSAENVQNEVLAHPSKAPSRSKIRPPPGLGQVMEAPLTGVLVLLNTNANIERACGEAILTASLNKRDMYSLVDDSTGNVLYRFEGTDAARFNVTGLKLGSTTKAVLKTALGFSIPGCEVMITVPSIAPPLPPRLLTVSDRQRSQVRLKWSPPSENGGSPITCYEVELSEIDAFDSFEKVAETIKPDCLVARLTVGTKYFTRIRAVNALGVSPYSQPAFCFTTIGAPCSQPSAVRLVAEFGESMEITWDEPEKTNGSDVDAYQVEMSRPQSDQFEVIYNDLPRDRVLVRSLAESSTYRFRVRAHNANGYSAWSSVSDLRTTVVAPKRMDAPLVVDAKGETCMAASFGSQVTVKWSRLGSGTAVDYITYHLEVRPHNSSQWDTAYVGSASSTSLKLDETGLYGRFTPGSKHLLSVSATNDRGQGPRSDLCELFVRPVPPAPPLGAPRVVKCDLRKGTMTIEFAPSPNSGGSPQVATVVEIRKQPSASPMALSAASRFPMVMSSANIKYFESDAQYKALMKERVGLAREKIPTVRLPPAKFAAGDLIDALYRDDGRMYHAEVVKVRLASTGDTDHKYDVRFVGYENVELVTESDMRPQLRRGEEVTAVLYDTTPGAHAAGTEFVVKENLRRLPAEVVSSTPEGYFVRFRGRGVAAQKTNAFDVFPCTAPLLPSVLDTSSPLSRSTSPASSLEESASKAQEQHRFGGHALPSDLVDREWFEACETSELICTIQALKPGGTYEIRLAAASECGGRGSFGPIHTVKMDAGVPLAPEAGPHVHACKPNGKVEVVLPDTQDSAGAVTTAYQMQWAPCNVYAVLDDGKHVVYSPEAFVPFEKTYESPNVSFVHSHAGESIVVRHRCKNRIGWGGWSKPSLVEIPPGPPSAVVSLEVKHVMNKQRSIRIAWMKPEKTNGSAIKSYLVQYKKAFSYKGKHQTEESWRDLETLVESVEIGELIPGASYDFRVRAANEHGAGSWATVSGFKISPIPPLAIPTDVEVTVKSHREFEAVWSFPDPDDELAHGGASVMFDYQYVPFQGVNPPPSTTLAKDVVIEGQSSARSVIKNSKSQVRPETSYWFRVRAINVAGASPFSAWAQFNTPTVPKETAASAVSLSAERLLVRQTTIDEDSHMTVYFDVLPSNQVDATMNVAMRAEFQERGSSAVHVVDRITEWTSTDKWLSCQLLIDELRPSTSYGLRVQFVRNGVRGEQSKSVTFTTRAAPVVLKDLPGPRQQQIEPENAHSKANTTVAATKIPKKGSKLQDGSAAFPLASILGNPIQITICVVSVLVAATKVYDFSPPVLAIGVLASGLLAAAHWYVFEVFLLPPKKSKQEKNEELKRLVKHEKDIKKKPLMKHAVVQIADETQPGFFSWKRAVARRDLLRVSTFGASLLLLISPIVVSIGWDVLEYFALLQLLGALVVTLLYSLPVTFNNSI